MRPDVNDVLACAGRNVVYGALSLTLATSCVPALAGIPVALAEYTPQGAGDEPPAEDESLFVLSVCSVGADGTRVELEEGASYASGEFVVLLGGEATVDVERTRVLLFDQSGEFVGEQAACMQGDAALTTSEVTFRVGDGDYGRMAFQVWDVCSRHADAEVSHVWIDTERPVVDLGLCLEEAASTRNGWAYFDRRREIPVSISDRNLDEERTTVFGHALKDLLETASGRIDLGGNLSCDAWDRTLDDAGRSVYSSTLHVDDGTYAMPVVHASDKIGFSANETEAEGSERIGGFVVDTQAPMVKATVEQSPSFGYEDAQARETLVFEGKVALRISAEDKGGVASVKLDEGSRQRGVDLKASPDGLGFILTSPQGIIDDSVVVIVRDHAGNERAWSMAPRGTVTLSGGVEEAQNEPVRDRRGNLLCSSGHPRMMVADAHKPRLSLGGIEDGEVLRAPRTITLAVEDDRWGHVALGDPQRTVAAVEKDGVVVAQCVAGYEGASASDASHQYTFEIPARRDHEDDGHYVLRGMAEDAAGHKAEPVHASFVVDTISPELEVTYVDDEGTHDEPAAIAAERQTVKLVLRESNFTEDVLNSPDAPVRLKATAGKGGDERDVAWGEWRRQDDETFVREVVFARDGTYTLRVEGTDLAGNQLVGGVAAQVEGGGFVTPELVVDTTAPEVTYQVSRDAGDPHAHEGVDYYRHPVTVRLCVTDRNFDERRSGLVGADGVPTNLRWKSSKPAADGNVAHVAEVTYSEDAAHADPREIALRLQAFDLASNESHVGPYRFVVDQSAPAVTSASLNKEASNACSMEGEDPLLFFNEQDGCRAELSISFADESLLDSVWVDDPDGAYAVRMDDVRGERSGRLVLTLKDPILHNQGEEAALTRDVRVFVQDYAGNTRVWSIDREGALVADHGTGGQNVSVGGLGIYPVALVNDAVAPVVRLEGASAGSYYNSPQAVVASVEERNFAYLQQFDARQAIVRCMRREGGEDGGQSTWTVTAGQFLGSGSVYTFEQPFSLDGHYEVRAQVIDIAQNPSESVEIGEFTIDTTPPRAFVTWNNDDVQNGMYYRAAREATVTIVEHNFDPSLVEWHTTGEVGSWESNGDAHACVVRFNADASPSDPHTLSVDAKDLAGNQMERLSEPDFVIDTVPPEVRFKRRVSTQDPFVVDPAELALEDESAFSRAIVPIVELVDDENLDTAAVEVSLGLAKGGSADASLLLHRELRGSNCLRVWWDNLGLALLDDGVYYRQDADNIYVLTAEAKDLAGNSSGVARVTFSVNRYGSNYLIERVDEREQSEWPMQDDALLTNPPRIVVHEINVSGMDAYGEGDDEQCVVTKEHAHATSRIERCAQRGSYGYVLERLQGEGLQSSAEGWSEYVYDIAPGNFGKGSDSDQGDGGQGSYRVDVSSVDRAGNRNTTAQYFDHGPSEVSASVPKVGEATVSFTLDEDGPEIKDLKVPSGVQIGEAFKASFRLEDEVTNGDEVHVLVNGEPVELYREGDVTPLPDDETLRQGTYWFSIKARPAFFVQDVQIKVSDYTKLASRTHEVRADGIRVTNLLWELALLVLSIVLLCRLVVARRKPA